MATSPNVNVSWRAWYTIIAQLMNHPELPRGEKFSPVEVQNAKDLGFKIIRQRKEKSQITDVHLRRWTPTQSEADVTPAP